MAIKVAGTTVIDDSRNISNTVTVTATTICASSFCGSGASLTNISGTVPTGSVLILPSGSPPAGYIRADGSVQLCATYPTLAACLALSPPDTYENTNPWAWNPTYGLTQCSTFLGASQDMCDFIGSSGCLVGVSFVKGGPRTISTNETGFGEYSSNGFCGSSIGFGISCCAYASRFCWLNNISAVGPCCEVNLLFYNCAGCRWSVNRIFQLHNNVDLFCQNCDAFGCLSICFTYGDTALPTIYCCGLLQTFTTPGYYVTYDLCCGCWQHGCNECYYTRFVPGCYTAPFSCFCDRLCFAEFGVMLHFLCALGTCRQCSSRVYTFFCSIFNSANFNPNCATNGHYWVSWPGCTSGTICCICACNNPYFNSIISCPTLSLGNGGQRISYAVGCDRIVAQGNCGLSVTCINSTTKAATIGCYGSVCGFGCSFGCTCGNFFSMTYFPKCNVFVGIRCNQIQTSSDGVTWTCRYSLPNSPDPGNHYAQINNSTTIPWSNLYPLGIGCIIAMNKNGYMVTSSDACTWTCRTFNETGFEATLVLPYTLYEKCESGCIWYHGFNFRINCDLSTIQLTAISNCCKLFRLNSCCYYAMPEEGTASLKCSRIYNAPVFGVFTSQDGLYWCHNCGFRAYCRCEETCGFTTHFHTQYHAKSCSLIIREAFLQCGQPGKITYCQYFPSTGCLCAHYTTSSPMYCFPWIFGCSSCFRTGCFVAGVTCTYPQFMCIYNRCLLGTDWFASISQDCLCAFADYFVYTRLDFYCCSLPVGFNILDASTMYYRYKCCQVDTCGQYCSTPLCACTCIPFCCVFGNIVCINKTIIGPFFYAYNIVGITDNVGTPSDCVYFSVSTLHFCGCCINSMIFPLSCCPAYVCKFPYGCIPGLQRPRLNCMTKFDNALCGNYPVAVSDCDFPFRGTICYAISSPSNYCYYGNRQTNETMPMLSIFLGSSSFMLPQCESGCYLYPGFAAQNCCSGLLNIGDVNYCYCGCSVFPCAFVNCPSPFGVFTVPYCTFGLECPTSGRLGSLLGFCVPTKYNGTTSFSLPKIKDGFIKT